jgi:hypothetical protein
MKRTAVVLALTSTIVACGPTDIADDAPDDIGPDETLGSDVLAESDHEEALIDTVEQDLLAAPLNVVQPDGSGALGPWQHLTYPSWGNRNHFGDDLVVAQGANIPLRAWSNGYVVDVVSSPADRNFNSLGYMALLRHPQHGRNGTDLYSISLHLRNPPAVSVGQCVVRGQTLGIVGQTGAANGTEHTHFELRYFASRFSNYGNIYGPVGQNVAGTAYVLNNWENPVLFQQINVQTAAQGNCPATVGIPAYVRAGALRTVTARFTDPERRAPALARIDYTYLAGGVIPTSSSANLAISAGAAGDGDYRFSANVIGTQFKYAVTFRDSGGTTVRRPAQGYYE